MAKCAECGGVILPDNQQRCDCIVPTPQGTKATLVERLRSRAVPVSISGVEQSDSIFTEAAAEIESSHREVHALSLLIEAHVEDEKELLAEIECLRAENESLRRQIATANETIRRYRRV